MKYKDGIPQVAPPNPDGRTRIIVPGGIGDVYWIMVKIEDFCKKNNVKGLPQIVVLSDPGTWESSRTRSLPFLRMLPFVELYNPPMLPMFPGGKRTESLAKMYSSLNQESIFPGFMGYEYFICYNGLINTGFYIEKDDPYECNWDLPLIESEHHKKYRDTCIKEFNNYAVFYFSFSGDFVRKNMQQFTIDQMAEGINTFTDKYNVRPVFVGSWWDLKWPNTDKIDYLPILISKIPKAVNLVGKTSLEEAFALMQGSRIVSGYHCGLTNMGLMFKKKSVLLWAKDRFPESTRWAVAPPDTRGTSYVPLFTNDLTTEEYVETMSRLYEEEVANDK